MLELENINLTMKNNGTEIQILKNINLSLDKGKLYAFAGPNGCGKSSLAKVIMGIYRPTTGRVIFQGEDITSLSVTERAKEGIGYAFQHPARFKGLKVKHLLEIALKQRNMIECQCLREVGLCPEDYFERELNSSLSGGEIKRVEIASVLAQRPLLGIFDEPEAGIDLWSFDMLLQVFKDNRCPDSATIIISHQEKILNMVDEIVLIVGGEVKLRGNKDAIWPLIREDAACACRENCDKGGELFADCPR